MASIKVKFRPSTASGREGSIYYQVIHGRIVRQVKTDYRIFDTEWDKRTSSVKILSEIGENRKRYLREVTEHIDWDTRRLKAIVDNATGREEFIPLTVSSRNSTGKRANNRCSASCRAS